MMLASLLYQIITTALPLQQHSVELKQKKTHRPIRIYVIFKHLTHQGFGPKALLSVRFSLKETVPKCITKYCLFL